LLFLLTFSYLPFSVEPDHNTFKRLRQVRENDLKIITVLLAQAQDFLREVEGDPSSVSLRDVKRFLDFLNFFMVFNYQLEENFFNSVVVSLAFVYYYRLPKDCHRKLFWKKICESNTHINMNTDEMIKISSFEQKGRYADSYSELYKKTLMENQKRFCIHLEIEEGIALNDALTENLFVTVVCILNKVRKESVELLTHTLI
jgi:hypothetical protein